MKKIIFNNPKKAILISFLVFLQGITGASIFLYINKFINILLSSPDLKTITFFSLIGAGIVLLLLFLDILVKKVIINYSIETTFLIRNDIMESIFKKRINEIIKYDSQYYISFILNDLPKLYGLVLAIFLLISNVFYFSVSIGVLFYLSWQITLLSILFLILVVLPLLYFSNRLNKSNIALSRNFANYTSKISEILSGIETIKEYKSEDFFLNIVNNEHNELMREEKKYAYINNKQEILMNFATSIMYFSLIILAAFLIFKGQLSISIISVLLYCSNLLTNLAVAIFNRLSLIITTKDLRQKYMDITDSKLIEFKDIKNIDNYNITISNLSFSYKNKPVLKNINLELKENKKYLLIGKSGSGKTTLLRLLSKELVNYKGEIKIGEDNINCIPDNIVYDSLSFVKQKSDIFDGTIKSNITFSNEADENKLKKVIKLAKLEDLIKSKTFGLDEKINNNLNSFSVGEKQRISIARALYRESKIYLFDEICSSLDKKTSEEIEKIVLDLPNALVINVAHKFSKNLLNKYDKIIFINDGEIKYFDHYSNIKDKSDLLDYLMEGRENENY